MSNSHMPTTPFRFILRFTKRYWWQCLVLVLICACGALDLSLRPYLIKLMLDNLERINPTEQLWKQLMWPVSAYIFLAFIINGLFRLSDYISLKTFPKLWEDVSLETIRYTQGHSYSFFQSHFGGTIVAKISELASNVQGIIDISIFRFLSSLLTLVIACYTMSRIHFHLMIILLIWLIIFTVGSYFFAQETHKLAVEASETQTTLLGRIIDSISNMLTVRLFAREKMEISFIAAQTRECTKKNQQLRWSDLKRQTFTETTSNVLIGFLLCYLVYARQKELVTIGDFALILTLSISVIDFVWNISRDFLQFSEALGKISQTLSLIARSFEIKDNEKATQLTVTGGRIEYRNVKFGYHAKELLFKNLSVEIPERQKVGLVGFSGSGKTTFANLIIRLYDIQEGAILIDNQDISNVTQNSLHERISYIPQDPALFHRTLYDNIKYGKTDATQAEVIEAAIKAHAHDFIEGMPQGYDTVVGEEGINLSGGQRQRIAIARAFLKNERILILDEATSALDSLTQYYIQESLRVLMEGKTVIAVAHRLSTLLHMDRILVFEKGNIIEDGTHHTLLAQKGTYAKLWDLQSNTYLG